MQEQLSETLHYVVPHGHRPVFEPGEPFSSDLKFIYEAAVDCVECFPDFSGESCWQSLASLNELLENRDMNGSPLPKGIYRQHHTLESWVCKLAEMGALVVRKTFSRTELVGR